MTFLPLAVFLAACVACAVYLWRLVHLVRVDVVAVPMILEDEAAQAWITGYPKMECRLVAVRESVAEEWKVNRWVQ